MIEEKTQSPCIDYSIEIFDWLKGMMVVSMEGHCTTLLDYGSNSFILFREG